MDLIITGKDLTINILVKAARHERLRISFAAQALKNMKKAGFEALPQRKVSQFMGCQ